MSVRTYECTLETNTQIFTVLLCLDNALNRMSCSVISQRLQHRTRPVRGVPVHRHEPSEHGKIYVERLQQPTWHARTGPTGPRTFIFSCFSSISWELSMKYACNAQNSKCDANGVYGQPDCCVIVHPLFCRRFSRCYQLAVNILKCCSNESMNRTVVCWHLLQTCWLCPQKQTLGFTCIK